MVKEFRQVLSKLSPPMILKDRKYQLTGGLLCLLLVFTAFTFQSGFDLPDSCEQIILVSADDWSSTTGSLLLLEKKKNQWDTVSTATTVNFGKNGLKWGRGLHANQEANEKQEGDGCAPVGVFELGLAFGYNEQPAGVSWPYQQLTDRDYFVDDINSKDYNTWQTISMDEANDPKSKWGSFERMKRNDHLYELGIVVKHNEDPIVKGMGSAIFLHVERAPGLPTLGCTSMQKADLLEVMQWLDFSKNPLFIQMPKEQLSQIVW
ncbi:MAG: hypothetical protein CMP48_21845 [Rickettsiales bacterium]|nr:hypothetical protein [Rickettsiales bacterium]